jgi:hypothetical protein
MRFLLSIAMLATAWTAGAQGTSQAILAYDANNVGDVFYSQTAGWTFQVTAPITVTDLGCVANFFTQNPSAALVQVGLWASDGSLLASSAITPGSPLLDQSRYEALAPLSLSPGQSYQIGAYYSDFFSLDTAIPLYGGSVTPAPLILLLGSASGSGGFASPATETGTAGGAYLGPNFRFQSQPKLAIRLSSASQLRLSWPTAFTGYTLQSKLGLFGSWANVSFPPATGPSVIGTEYVVFDVLGSVPEYYRLVK